MLPTVDRSVLYRASTNLASAIKVDMELNRRPDLTYMDEQGEAAANYIDSHTRRSESS
jgi:hypothetical protein